VLNFKPLTHPRQIAPGCCHQSILFNPISGIAEIFNVYYTLDPFGCKQLGKNEECWRNFDLIEGRYRAHGYPIADCGLRIVDYN
jgi:hypothetical protein